MEMLVFRTLYTVVQKYYCMFLNSRDNAAQEKPVATSQSAIFATIWGQPRSRNFARIVRGNVVVRDSQFCDLPSHFGLTIFLSY